jgi:hypothetical protein
LRTFILILIGAAGLLIRPASARSQEIETKGGSESTVTKIEQRHLIDVPTAGVMGRGQYEVGMRLFDNGGVLAHINVGITDRFMIGIAYGGERIVGSGEINFNPLPGVDVRYRMIDETEVGPAVTVGFSSQGYGPFVKNIRTATDTTEVDRYTHKSRGLFAAASKNYRFLGNLGLHGGISWAAHEKKDKDNQPTVFVGMDKSINNELSVVGEYDLALNDDKDLIGHGRGYLNVGAKLNFSNEVLFELMVRDLLNNSKDFGKFAREVRLSIVRAF